MSDHILIKVNWSHFVYYPSNILHNMRILKIMEYHSKIRHLLKHIQPSDRSEREYLMVCKLQ